MVVNSYESPLAESRLVGKPAVRRSTIFGDTVATFLISALLLSLKLPAISRHGPPTSLERIADILIFGTIGIMFAIAGRSDCPFHRPKVQTIVGPGQHRPAAQPRHPCGGRLRCGAEGGGVVN